MVSIFVEKEQITGDIITVTDKNDINHLKNSFRMKIGDALRVVDGEREYFCKVVSVGKKEIEVEIEEVFEDRYSTKTHIDIAMGILKKDKMELAIQKLTEIGVNRIIPLQTKRTIVKIDGKKEKWDVVSKEALKQCQGVKKVKIEDTAKLEEIDYSNYDLILVPYEKEEEKSIYEILREKENVKNVLYLIGPEGGFAPEEIEYLMSIGAEIITLGKRILRAETAAIVVGGILVNEFQ
jgi:16S rRNA (uracil1498-N3)-methyltransferase